MSRWRTPVGYGAPYITAAGFRALEDESRLLWARRREVVRHLAAAAAEGDRSENAEYQYRKKELRGIDRRIGYLQRRMPRLEIVRAAPADRGRIYFGATVELEDEQGELRRYRIVGVDEAEPGQGAISVDSPLARGLLGRALDETVHLSGVQGEARYVVTAIEYPDVAG